jgi:hypothetical protein
MNYDELSIRLAEQRSCSHCGRMDTHSHEAAPGTIFRGGHSYTMHLGEDGYLHATDVTESDAGGLAPPATQAGI